MRPILLLSAIATVALLAAHRDTTSHSVAALPARTIAPNAATIGSGASLQSSGGESLTNEDAAYGHGRAPQGEPTPERKNGVRTTGAPPAGDPSAPAGAFNLSGLAADLVIAGNNQNGCQCGPDCQCRTLKKQAENFNVATELKTPAPAQPPAPAYVPTYAPVAQRAAPFTYQYRPTPYYYAPSACGPGGCSPAGGFFRRRRW